MKVRAAPLGGRQRGLQALETVAALDARDARAAGVHRGEGAEHRLERVHFRALQLDEHGAILFAQRTHRKQRGARVEIGVLELPRSSPSKAR